MVLFFDPKDEQELRRVEGILRRGAIGYFLRPEPEEGIGPMQIHVAEEDLPKAEKLLLMATLH